MVNGNKGGKNSNNHSGDSNGDQHSSDNKNTKWLIYHSGFKF